MNDLAKFFRCSVLWRRRCLVHYAIQRGSIKMESNTDFVDAIYDTVKAQETYRTDF